MHKLKDMLMDELLEIESKFQKGSGGKLSAGDLEYIHKLTDTVKNIDKIEMLEESSGYSEDRGEWMARGNYGGHSYDDGGSSYGSHRGTIGRYSRNDSGYSREGNYSEESRNGYSEKRHYVRGHYSRGDAKEHMMNKMDEMMDMAGSEKEKEIIRQTMERLRNI